MAGPLARVWQQASVERYFTYGLLLFVLAFIGLPSSKAVNNYYYVFLGLPGLWLLLRNRWPAAQSSLLLWLWVIFLLWTLVASVQVATVQYIKHWLYTAVFCGLTLLLVDHRFFRRDSVIHWLFIAVLAYILLGTLYLWLTGRYVLGARVNMPMRLGSPTYASIVLTAFFSMVMLRLVRLRRWGLLGLYAALVLFVTGYILQSRAGVLGLMIVIGSVALYCLWSAKQWWIRLSLMLVCLAVAFGVGYLFEAVSTFEGLVERADAGRFELWKAHFQAFRDCHSWLGCAPAHFEGITTFGGRLLVEHPHNVLFSVLLYHGWVGFFLFSAILILTLMSASRQRNPWGLFLLTGLLMLMFEGGGLIDQPNELWLLVLMPCMLILAENTRARFTVG